MEWWNRFVSIGTSIRRLAQLGMWLVIVAAPAAAQPSCQPDWPLWRDFGKYFVEDSGRVVDASTPEQRSSSESQSYGMFFALVANDRVAFDRMWKWSIDNLGSGDLSQRLPAWNWGRDSDGHWRILDQNSASDADLWYVYSLLEAGRLWNEPAYTRQARMLLASIEAQELAELPGLGMMLLPGKDGFAHPEEKVWQLNPSYLPLPVLRRLELESPNGPWRQIAQNTVAMLEAVSPRGFAPDWITYQVARRPPSFVKRQARDAVGSYDAIRTYLWAGMTAPEDPAFGRVLSALDGMVDATRGQGRGMPPEIVDTITGHVKGTGPSGFSAALIPYFKAKGHAVLQRQQQARVENMLRESVMPERLRQGQPNYYDYVLSLFAMGWLDGLYRFKADGALSTSWGNTCRGTGN
jgi:Endoglucanase Y